MMIAQRVRNPALISISCEAGAGSICIIHVQIVSN